MTKYTYTEKKIHNAEYRTHVRPELLDEICEQILRKMIVEKKYRDTSYTARQLAQDIGTNVRYISAAVNLRFGMNYPELVGGYRVREAAALLADRRHVGKTMGQIAQECGFSSRQSFYATFYKTYGKTPKEYQASYLVRTADKVKADKEKQKRKLKVDN